MAMLMYAGSLPYTLKASDKFITIAGQEVDLTDQIIVLGY